MSFTVIQRFYELAKQEAEAPALGLEDDGSYHDLPWWFVKSKVKHFALGLLEDGAQPGDYFYLFPSNHPTWIYAELGALTIGLQTLPLPANITSHRLSELFERYPPVFIYSGNIATKDLSAFPLKSLRRWVFSTDTLSSSDNNLHTSSSFRRLFNMGIRTESKHHHVYRRIRQSLSETQIMSPIWVDQKGNISNQVLRHKDVNIMAEKLSHACRLRRPKKIYSDVDLSYSLGRIACLYWPIFLAVQSILSFRGGDHFSQIRLQKPDLVYLSDTQLFEFEKELSPWFLFRRQDGKTTDRQTSHPGYLRKLWGRHLLKKHLGGRLKIVLTTEPLSPLIRATLDSSKVKALSLQELLSSDVKNL